MNQLVVIATLGELLATIYRQLGEAQARIAELEAAASASESPGATR
jgi:hypothetical protein